MADINFNCSRCGQNLDAPEHMAGMVIFCPSCKREIIIPRPPPAPEDTPSQDELKGTTVRMELPAEFNVPTPQKRVITIKRPK